MVDVTPDSFLVLDAKRAELASFIDVSPFSLFAAIDAMKSMREADCVTRASTGAVLAWHHRVNGPSLFSWFLKLSRCAA